MDAKRLSMHEMAAALSNGDNFSWQFSRVGEHVSDFDLIYAFIFGFHD